MRNKNFKLTVVSQKFNMLLMVLRFIDIYGEDSPSSVLMLTCSPKFFSCRLQLVVECMSGSGLMVATAMNSKAIEIITALIVRK